MVWGIILNLLELLVFVDQFILKVGDCLFVGIGFYFELLDKLGLEFMLLKVFLELIFELLEFLVPRGNAELFFVKLFIWSSELLGQLVVLWLKDLSHVPVLEFDLVELLCRGSQLIWKGTLGWVLFIDGSLHLTNNSFLVQKLLFVSCAHLIHVILIDEGKSFILSLLFSNLII